MNRFKNKHIPAQKLDFDFIGGEGEKECYRFHQAGYEIYCKDFDVHVDLELYHYPQAEKNDSFGIHNITVHTDETTLKLYAPEMEDLYIKIRDSIEITGLHAW